MKEGLQPPYSYALDLLQLVPALEVVGPRAADEMMFPILGPKFPTNHVISRLCIPRHFS